jgi:Right handed beta helix region
MSTLKVDTIKNVVESKTISVANLVDSTTLSASGGSAAVGFVQAGTGVVARTTQAKLRDFVSVKDFGAVGDGVTDDGPAILAAATYISGLGGGVVNLPPPTVAYAMNPTYFDNLTGVAFVGQLTKVMALLPGSVAQAPFSFRNCTDIEIFGLDIDGRYPYWITQALTTTVNNHNIYIQGCDRVKIHGCYLHDSGANRTSTDKFGDGVYINGLSKNISITNNRFFNDGRWSVACVSSAGNLRIANNISEFDSLAPALGVYDIEISSVAQLNNVTISDNTAVGRTVINFSGANGFKNVVVSGNNLSGYDLSGGQKTGVYTYGIAFENVVGGIISGNNVNGHASAQAVSLVSCSYVNIIGNVLKSIDGPTYPPNGGYISASNNCVISDNQFLVNRASGYGLQLANACSNMTIQGNVISNPLEYALFCNANSSKVIGNTFVSATNEACSLVSPGLTGYTVIGNYSITSGRLPAEPHYVANNNMTFSATSGNWWEGGGTYINPDKSKGRSFLYLSAAPTAGTWARGDIVKNSAPSVGAARGWVCTVAGTPGTWVSEGNL